MFLNDELSFMISFDLISEPLQVILAANINSRLRGFGISFSSAKVDLDSNNLSDLAVGKKNEPSH
jgi:hypothetical protein